MNYIEENWDLIKETLRTEYDLSDISYNTWVKPLNYHSVKDDIVTIIIPSDQAHALKYISSKYKSYFQVTQGLSGHLWFFPFCSFFPHSFSDPSSSNLWARASISLFRGLSFLQGTPP